MAEMANNSSTEGMESTKRCLFPEDDWAPEVPSKDIAAPDHETTADSRWEIDSPTSVAVHPDIAGDGYRGITQPTILMGETGAEVSLDFSSMKLSTPQKQMPAPGRPVNVGQSSLLDTEATPTPSKKRNLVDSPAWERWVDDDDGISTRSAYLECTIATLLEEPEEIETQGGGCNDWQVWSFFLSSDNRDGEPSTENIKSGLRNRAFDLDGRKMRVHRLSQNLSPFASSHSTPIYRSRSFSIEDHANAIVRVSKDKRRSLASVLQLCTMPENVITESPIKRKRSQDGIVADVCYDSDPEDFTRKRTSQRVEAQLQAEKENIQNYEKFSYPRSISTSPTGNWDDQLNEAAYRTVVQEFLNQTFTLIFHPNSKRMPQSGRVPQGAPVGVHAWLERGQQLYDPIQPKWMWRAKPGTGTGIQIVSGIELLDISRIWKLHKVDRTVYPLAKPRHCFVVKTIDKEEYCFEAKSTMELNRVVYSLKLVIARFGAKVLMADHSVYDEFFASTKAEPLPDEPKPLRMLV